MGSLCGVAALPTRWGKCCSEESPWSPADREKRAMTEGPEDCESSAKLMESWCREFLKKGKLRVKSCQERFLGVTGVMTGICVLVG